MAGRPMGVPISAGEVHDQPGMMGLNIMARWMIAGLWGMAVLMAGCPSNPGTSIQVPDVVGLSQATAQSVITAAGLSVGEVVEEASETVPVGNVIRQYPAAGINVLPGSAIQLVVSTGSARGGIALFTATPTAGLVPLEVAFSDQSIAEEDAIVSWNWDFGDGTGSTEQNPVHRFTDPGRYTVRLTVTTSQGTNSVIMADYINGAFSIPAAFSQLTSPVVDAQEAADNLFDAVDAVFENEGMEAAGEALEAARLNYFNQGGDPLVLNRRSAAIPAGGFDPKTVQQRRAARKRTGRSWPCVDETPGDLKRGLAKENTVSAPQNIVIHLNGLNTDYTAAIKLYFGLKEALNPYAASASMEMHWFNNPSAFGFWEKVFDVRECTVSRLLDWMADSASSITPLNSEVIQCSALIQEYIAAGKNVILVAYSEGNYYAGEASGLLSAAHRGQVAIIETGSPVSSMPALLKGDVRVDIKEDPVTLLSGRVTNSYLYEGDWTPSVSPMWLSLLDNGSVSMETIAAIELHSFLGGYLKGQAGQAVVDHVLAFCVLPSPVITAFALNNGAPETTSPTVTLNALCNGVATAYQVSESSGFSGAVWQPYANVPTYTFVSTTSGVKTLFFRVKNTSGVLSPPVSDTILLSLQQSTPSITQITPNPVPGVSGHQMLTLLGRGFTQGCVVLLRNKTLAGGPWTKTPISVSSTAIVLDANLGIPNAVWSVQVRNGDGGYSEEVLFSVLTPVVLPVVQGFACNGGLPAALSATITLNNVCTGPPAQYLASESADFSGADWRPYSEAPRFTVSPGNGTKAVYFKVKNTVGESAVVSDAIQVNDDTNTVEEKILLPGNVPLEMVWCPAGTFMMGRYSEEQDSNSNESPQHPVTISSGFWMGKYEVTKAQWTAVMGTTPWKSQNYVLEDPDSPAVYVSWNDAQAFLLALNQYTGLAFRLPTEAQWEYAARAGTVTRYYWGDDPDYSEIGHYAWRLANTWNVGETYAQVAGQKLPNGFRLHDMIGNVWEWCNDWFGRYGSGAQTNPIGPVSGTYRVGRGGSWYNFDYFCRSAYRGLFVPDNSTYDIGFRLAR